MYNLTNQLLDQYEMEFGDIQKGRGVYVCSTNRGFVTFKEFSGSKEHAEAMNRIEELLRQAGVQADCMIATKEGGLLARDADERMYYARWQLKGRECETRDREDMLKAMELLGRMHAALKGAQVDCQRVPREALAREMERHNREIRKVRNYVRGKNKKNEFELLFLHHYKEFLEQAEESLCSLEQWMERVNESDGSRIYGICHGDYNQHNVLFDKGQGAVTNFELACYDLWVRDLAHFLRKLMEKHDWNISLAQELLAAYEKERKLTGEEWQQLYIRMSYPQKFWKVANHYFNANKAWVSGRDIEKLGKVIAQEEKRQEFLRMLFNFTE
ncbi:MAG: CotS family spore coat protein [Roseburia sp.]